MKRLVFYIIIFFSVVLGACTDDMEFQNKVGDKEVWATLKFGHHDFETVDVQSRATLNEIAESRVENLFVYVFDSTGKRLYSHFYDYTNRVETLPNTAGNYWTVNNRTSSNNNDTEGEVMIKSPMMEGGRIYLIANLNADQLNISADQLNTIETLSELEAITITMNQQITSRTGCFLMTGQEDGVAVNEMGEISKNGATIRIPLVRLDAKVTVNVVVGDAKQSNQKMKGFIPESWQVMRLPKATRLLTAEGDATHLGYFDSEEQFFETDVNGAKGFSFYMLENKKDTKGLTSYRQREERHKRANGSYDIASGMWKNVSDDATYLILKGKVQMEVDTDDESTMQYLEADVTYFVHLGNFGDSNSGGDYNNFTVNRNTHYTYTITVSGVQNIEVEVTTDVENQPGAIGDVYKSREEIYSFDAHYGQRVYRINAESILENTITWYVKTPFSDGMPGLESGTQIPNLDYKWVWFMLNKENANGSYSTNNQWYPGDRYREEAVDASDKLMNVVEFVKFIKEEKIKYDNATAAQKPTASAFRRDADGTYCLYVTVFVDEYYYDADPLNSTNKPQDLWKKFVNKPNRLLHILCDSKVSKDGDSSLTNSVITIRQHSIQTPYNIDKDELKTAWGCESKDEFASSQLYFYSSSETMTTTENDQYKLGYIGETSQVNGLYNTIKMWGITPGVTRWDSFLNYNRDNDYSVTINNNRISTYFLNDNSVSLRYATLLRNRDNNGNGIIDADELKWYVASMNQLYDLYIGQLGINSDAALYTAQMAAQPNETYTTGPYRGAYKWRNHVICSTWNGGTSSSAQVRVLWAEEGISVSGYFERYEKYAPFSVRTVRNLGLITPAYSTEGVEGVGYPVPLVNVSENGKGGYLFDLTNVNEKSLRYYTSRELEHGDENAESSRVYYGFETGPTVTRTAVNGNNNLGNYQSLIGALEAGTETGCDTENGYRVPNVREGALMALYCPSSWWNGGYTMVGTWYSNGDRITGGNGNDAGYYSWQFSHNFASIGRTGVNTIRSVRDWRP